MLSENPSGRNEAKPQTAPLIMRPLQTISAATGISRRQELADIGLGGAHLLQSRYSTSARYGVHPRPHRGRGRGEGAGHDDTIARERKPIVPSFSHLIPVWNCCPPCPLTPTLSPDRGEGAALSQFTRPLERGDSSPLPAGDLSPSKSRAHPTASHQFRRPKFGQEDFGAGKSKLHAAIFRPNPLPALGKRIDSPHSLVPIRLTPSP